MVETKAEQKPIAGASGVPGQSFVRFACYQADSAFRRLDANMRLQAKEDALSAFDLFKERMTLATYNLMATRADSDFLIRQIADDLEILENFAARLARSGMGPYLRMTRSYLALNSGNSGDTKLNSAELSIVSPPELASPRFLFVHPVVFNCGESDARATRQKVLGEYAGVAARHPSVKLSVGYSCGFDDQDLVLAFEAESLSDFLELHEEIGRLAGVPRAWPGAPALMGISPDLKLIFGALG